VRVTARERECVRVRFVRVRVRAHLAEGEEHVEGRALEHLGEALERRAAEDPIEDAAN
jgi:hypothetical protein